MPHKTIEYRMSDGREVQVELSERSGGVYAQETFDAETEHSPELQRKGGQAILENFRRHVAANASRQALKCSTWTGRSAKCARALQVPSQSSWVRALAPGLESVPTFDSVASDADCLMGSA